MVLAGPIRGGGAECGAPMENWVRSRSADVEIVWSALNLDISSERGALSYSEMGSESGAATEK